MARFKLHIVTPQIEKGLKLVLITIHKIFSVHGINGVSVQYKKKACICCIFLMHSNTTGAKSPLNGLSEIRLLTHTGRCSQALCISTGFKLTVLCYTTHFCFLNAISQETKCNKNVSEPSPYSVWLHISVSFNGKWHQQNIQSS